MTKEQLAAYYGLANDVCNDYIKRYKIPKYQKEDLHSVCLEGLMLANRDYDESKGAQFHTYASNRMRTSMYNFCEKERRYRTPLTDIEDVDLLNVPMETKEGGEEHDWSLVEKWEPKDEKDREIYNRCIMGNTTYTKLAEELGSSRNTIKTRKKRLVKKLKKQMLEDTEVLSKLKEDKETKEQGE